MKRLEDENAKQDEGVMQMSEQATASGYAEEYVEQLRAEIERLRADLVHLRKATISDRQEITRLRAENAILESRLQIEIETRQRLTDPRRALEEGKE